MKFSEEQVEYIEDKIINLIFPTHARLSMLYVYGKKIDKKDLRDMIKDLEKAAKFIRNLRPKYKRIRR